MVTFWRGNYILHYCPLRSESTGYMFLWLTWISVWTKNGVVAEMKPVNVHAMWMGLEKNSHTRLSSLWPGKDFLPMATVSVISRLLEIFLVTASANDKFISTSDGVMTRKHIPHYRTFGEYPPDSLPSASDVGHWCGILGRELGPSGVSPNQNSRWKLAFSPLKHV